MAQIWASSANYGKPPTPCATTWMLHRNLLSHTYDIKVFEAVLQTVAEQYFPAFDRLHEFFLSRSMEP